MHTEFRVPNQGVLQQMYHRFGMLRVYLKVPNYTEFRVSSRPQAWDVWGLLRRTDFQS